jgi:hypothetical protein
MGQGEVWNINKKGMTSLEHREKREKPTLSGFISVHFKTYRIEASPLQS